jgi:cell division protein FtsI (penicillin-binding protein 3)
MNVVGAGAQSRSRWVFGLLLVALLILVGRAGWIQLVRGEELARQARRQHFRQVEVHAPRGRILDRQGRVLVASYHSRSIAVDPQRIEDVPAFAATLAFLLEDAAAAPALAERIRERRAAGTRFAYLRRRVDRDLSDSVLRSDLVGLDVREEPRREYPHGEAAAAVLGVVGADAEGRIAGLTGLERRFDAALRGREGSCSVFRSGRPCDAGYHLYPECDREAQAGGDLETTLDVVLQTVVEEALDSVVERFRPVSACALVLSVDDCGILAMAGRPALDPCRFPEVEAESLRIPAIHKVYEHGSTIKPLILAWAVARGAVQPGQMIDCGPGAKRFGGRTVHDVKPNGVLPLRRVLVKSSNIGMGQVAQALGIEETHAYLHALGLGRPTGVELDGEEVGRISPRAKWSENYTLVSVGFGRELMATPLQVARAYCALLNGGYLWQPTLLRRACRPAPVRLDFGKDALDFVREAMVSVVEEGTGRRARIRGSRIGGKTGTSKDYFDPDGKYVSSFIGFAPADDPAVLAMVVVEDPRKVEGVRPFGGVVAAPAVREILRRGLPLVASSESNRALPGSGVRRKLGTKDRKVRVAAVHWSSVNAGERISPQSGRNPDSGGAQPCRSGR